MKKYDLLKGVLVKQKALERLGWDFSGLGISEPYDHVKIIRCEYTDRLKWSPCDQYGNDSLAASGDTGDDEKTLEDLDILAIRNQVWQL